MQPTLTIRHEGNIDLTNGTMMTFDEDAIAHLMGVLTDLYSDPILAVLREYSTNALDSHVAAGNTAPIEISLPSAFNPTFTVQDFGVGLSIDDILSHLTKYGWSSKRDSNEAVGMLGLGFKSALTYTSQFSVTAVKDGVKAVVLVTRAEDGRGQVEVIDTLGTDEPNGVAVQIPVSYVPTFNEKAEQFFRFWEPGTVLVNGEEPEGIVGTEIDPWITLTKAVREDYIVMGNVPYPVAYDQRITRFSDSTKAVVRVPIGAVNFTPSREALQMNKRTKETLEDARSWIDQHVRGLAEADVAAAESPYDALLRARKWRGMMPGLRKMEYKGEPIPTQFYGDTPCVFWSIGQAKSKTVKYAIGGDDFLRAAHVVNYTARGLNGHAKDIIKSALATKGVYSGQVYLSPGTDRQWMNPEMVIDWQELKAAAKAAAKANRTETVVYYVVGTGSLPMDEIDDTKDVCYVFKTDLDRNYSTSVLRSFAPDHTIVMLGKNQQSKFLRHFPDAENIATMIKTEAAEHVGSLTNEQAALVNERLSGITSLAGHDIHDPDLVALIDLASGKADDFDRDAWVMRRQQIYNAARQLGMLYSVNMNPKAEGLEVLERYPLVEFDYGMRNVEAVVEYINVMYAHRQKGQN